MRILAFFVGCTLLTNCGKPSPSDLAASSPPGASQAFPLAPDPKVTPGSLCDQADEYRYPEQINYCARNVAVATKKLVKETYQGLGYRVSLVQQSKFKIDHYISLCMGGSNSISNLWPQHESIYKLTDPIEAKLCRLLASGKIMQAEAIATIKLAKTNLQEIEAINERLDSMLP